MDPNQYAIELVIYLLVLVVYFYELIVCMGHFMGDARKSTSFQKSYSTHFVVFYVITI